MFSDSENRTLSGLRLAVTRRYGETDEVERLIDGLCDSLSGAQAYSMSFVIAMSQRDSGDKRSAALLPIFSLGFKAIPALLRHAGDQRLSRGTQERTNMAFTGPAEATVGDICLNIVEQFSTIPRELYSNREREGRLRKWWQSAKELSDRENFIAAVESHANSNLPAGLLAWAEGQPNMLVEAYRNALDRGRPNAAADLLDSLQRSKSDRQRILDQAELGLKAATLDPVFAALNIFRKLDASQFDKALVGALDRWPGGYEPSKTASLDYFGVLTSFSSSPSVWDAFARTTRRADVSDRIGLLRNSSYELSQSEGRKHYLRCVLSFFEDTTSGPEGNPGQSVQNIAAAGAAYELGIKAVPEPAAGKAVWDAFRAEVSRQIEAYLSKTSRSK